MMTKMVMPQAADELVGFVPFRPGTHRVEGIMLIVAKTYIRLSDEAMHELGDPEYAVVFFDRIGKRMMVTPADGNTRNIIRISPMAKTEKRCILTAEGLRKELRSVVGEDVRLLKFFPGKKAKSEATALIFDLNTEEK